MTTVNAYDAAEPLPRLWERDPLIAGEVWARVDRLLAAGRPVHVVSIMTGVSSRGIVRHRERQRRQAA